MLATMKGRVTRATVAGQFRVSPVAHVIDSLAVFQGRASIFSWTTRGICNKYSDVQIECVLHVDVDWFVCKYSCYLFALCGHIEEKRKRIVRITSAFSSLPLSYAGMIQ